MSTRLDNASVAQPARHRQSAATAALSGAAVRDQNAWDTALQGLGGHLMQSWRWGEFKRHEGWRVERIHVTGDQGTGLAQVLFWPRGPVCTAFIPRGPAISGDSGAVAAALLPELDAACQRHRALSLAIEAGEQTPFNLQPERHGFATVQTRHSPGRTVIVPLLEDDALLAQMNSGTRAKVRRAQRHGVEIERSTPDAASVERFHAMLRETSTRQGFRINPPDHYLEALRIFGADASLHLATVEGRSVAGLIAARFGDLAIYLFGASLSDQPVRGATALLQFEAMRWARDSGSTQYDLWGIDSSQDAADDSLDRSISRECAEDDGLCRFKVGFGGEVVVLPRRIERAYHPHLDRVLRRVNDLRQGLRR
jgi:lipid II:glycine glycyltransferase (peptidoglycan interpeptide bridge formation enzyme)